MTVWPALFLAVAAVLAGGYAWFTIRHWTAPLFVTCLAIAGAFAVSLAMGLPRPAPLVMLGMFEDVEIAHHQLDEPNAIYLWTAAKPPVAWSLPWDQTMAKRLHEQSKAAEGEGQPLVMKRNHMGEFVFHPKTRPPLPPKG
jgi:hypothetical protein